MTFFSLSADFDPLLAVPVLASLPAPAATPAGAPASAPAAALSAPLNPLSASTSPEPAAFTVTVNAVAVSPFYDTSKLVSGRTPAFTPTPGPSPTLTPAPTSAPAVSIPMPSGTVIPFADTGLAVLHSKIFHHGLQLLCLWFFFPEMSEVKRVRQVIIYSNNFTRCVFLYILYRCQCDIDNLLRVDIPTVFQHK